jgi:hypothetical protein
MAGKGKSRCSLLRIGTLPQAILDIFLCRDFLLPLRLRPMATNGETDDIDLETLQAQIDASLAQTFALVDSWKTPAFPQATSGRITEADFGAILRRPPRSVSRTFSSCSTRQL